MMKYVAEFLGTFFFLSVILAATAKNALAPALTPIMIVVGLLAAIVVAGPSSGAHLNPAVSVMMALNKSLPVADFLPYVGAQLLGAVAAKTVFDMMNKK
jgi:glycerol uptake facilitator-like aquaporin